MLVDFLVFACLNQQEFLEHDNILKYLKISRDVFSYIPPPFGAVSKKFLFLQLSKIQNPEELSSYGEIQSEWHEGSPDWAFAPPN